MSAAMEVSADVQDGVSEEMVNGDIEEDADGLAELSKDLSSRPIRKAKRLLGRQSPGKEVAAEGAAGQAKKTLPPTLAKNSRKSRDGRGRGLPKKGGAGGKGVWGKPGEEVNEDGHCQDSHDPNYDSESEEEYLIEEIDPEVTLEELERLLEPAVLEYYENNNAQEFVRSLEDLNLGTKKPKLVEYLVSKAIDHKAAHCEMTSVLLSELYSRVLHHNDIMSGFDDLLGKLTDLVLDAPHAPEVVGKFIARAVADDCLPPKYVQGHKGKADCKNSEEAISKADILLNQKHGIVRLDNIWGTGGGIRPVKSLIKRMVMLLQEYLSSGDIAEATRCLKDLEVPHFHHELVYEAINMVFEKSTDRAAEMMVKLLKSLSNAIIVTQDQLNQGFQRIFDNIADICLDVPNAYSILDKFATLCHKEKIIDDALLQKVPQRGRKRFVSEGDGGKVKNS
ncbi:programmed cell death protein 4 [Aplysia californica]|uniref:Programmed cell death protein 4 n=1 Tax=Aplysia californica TaxID=6500 RepID=A0ABM0ZUC7_APLCA|nr:programmed cell death protein 4 [Aplysia californica]